MTTRLALTLAACLAIAGAVGGAYVKGRADGAALTRAEQIEATAALQARIDEAAENLARVNAALLAARAARHQTAREIEDETRADPAAADRRPSPDSLRRLERRWGASPAP